MTFDEFVNELRTKSKKCSFNEERDLVIRDKIIFGIRDERLHEQLLRDSENTDLQQVIDLCWAIECQCSRNQ